MVIDPNSLLIDKYFQKASREDQAKYLRGQIYMCPCLYFRPDVQLLRLKYPDPYHKESRFVLDPIGPDSFTDAHKPNTNPPVEADEELIVFRSKKRPLIILSTETVPWPLSGGRPRPQSFLAAPIYSFHPRHSETWKAKVLVYNYPDLFYLPGDAELEFNEGFIRFDQIQVVPKEWLEPRGMCLSADAYELLMSWLVFYVSGEEYGLTTLILEYRNAKLPMLPSAS